MAKQKVAVLGGGVGAMTTAFYLSSFQGWREKYDITVYQLGWRLGGKCDSGRNQAEHDRIEEHGLHMFFGFYDNAFATMQRLYGELGRYPVAFKTCDTMVSGICIRLTRATRWRQVAAFRRCRAVLPARSKRRRR